MIHREVRRRSLITEGSSIQSETRSGGPLRRVEGSLEHGSSIAIAITMMAATIA